MKQQSKNKMKKNPWLMSRIYLFGRAGSKAQRAVCLCLPRIFQLTTLPLCLYLLGKHFKWNEFFVFANDCLSLSSLLKGIASKVLGFRKTRVCGWWWNIEILLGILVNVNGLNKLIFIFIRRFTCIGFLQLKKNCLQ